MRVVLNVLNNDRAERISAVQGTTYNLVGGQPVATALDASQVFRKQLDQNLVECAFTLPNVKAGSIIEFTYTVTSDFLYNLTPWEFEKDIPVRWSELRATLPEYLTFKTSIRGTRPFAVEESRTVPYSTTIRRPHLSDERLTGSALALRWVLKDVPAFHPEPLMDAPVNYRKRIGFELAGTHLDLNTREYADISGQWKSLWESLQQHASFGRALTEPAPLAEAARQLRAQFPTDEEARAAAVLALVQRGVVFNRQGGLYTTQSLRRVAELRQGSAADINLLLVQTLREAGLNATPLLLSTRGHGQVQTAVPVLAEFDYVAAHLALPSRSADVLLDATDPLLPLGMLPEYALNGQGRLADATGRWVEMAPASRYTCLSTALLRLTPQGTMEGSVRLAYLGYAALEEQQHLRRISEQGYVGQARQQYAEWHPTHLLLDRKDTTQLPLALTMDVRVPLDAPKAELLYVPLLQFTAPPQYPFQLPERQFPLSLGTAQEHTNTATLTLPPRLHRADAAAAPEPGAARRRGPVPVPGNPDQPPNRAADRPPPAAAPRVYARRVRQPAPALPARPGPVRRDGGSAAGDEITNRAQGPGPA